MLRKQIYTTMANKYKADFNAKLLNLESLINNPQSIPEHSDFVGELDKIFSELVELEDKIQLVSSLESNIK